MTEPALDYKHLVQDDRIHASLYTDPRIFADEMDRIFHRGWVFVGHESEIPQPGDFVTRHLGAEPVIMVRGNDGGVSVLINRCRHRGTMVCPADRGSARTLTCPYHGWTYDLRGELPGVPYPGGYDTFDKKANGLTRAPRVSSYRGFVFASLSAEGLSLAEHLGPATKLIDRSCDLSPVGEIELTAGNGRLLRMAEAGMGPASFLMPDDLIVAGRNQLGLHARTTPWLLLGRGLNRETIDALGRTVSHVTDETTNRGFWRHFRTVMTEA